MFRQNMSNKPLSVLPHQKKKTKQEKKQQQKKTRFHAAPFSTFIYCFKIAPEFYVFPCRSRVAKH